MEPTNLRIMNEDKSDMIKDIKNTKKIYQLHLFYVCVICSIFIIFNVCFIPEKVSDAAFQNFSFASSIVSIVLAVVSIVYSLWSGKSSNSQYDSIRHIERQIDTQLDSFKIIDSSIKTTLSTQQQKLNQMHEDQTKIFNKIRSSAFIGTSNSKPNQTENFNINNNPDVANICLFFFCLSSDKQKKLPVKLLNKNFELYWAGYLVGISRSLPTRISYRKEGDSILITHFDTTFFNTADELEKWITVNASSYNSIIDEAKIEFQ